MDYDMIFNFTSYISEKNLLLEEIKIKKFLKNIEIKDNKISKNVKNKEVPIVLLELENNKKIIFKDEPINFFLAYGYLLGEDTELVEIKFKEINEHIILEKELLDEFTDEIETVYDKINPKDLFLKKVKNTFEISPYLKQIKSYIGNKKKINLDKIHIIKGTGLRLFNPTTKFADFKLARVMNIPLVSMISDNFIIDSNVNIYDHNTLINSLNPLKTIEEERIVEKFKNKNIYRDITQDYFVEINIKEIISKLDNIKKSNIETSLLSNELINYTKIQISSNNGKYVLPLFKEKNNRKYYPIKNTQEFFELSGVYFKDDEKTLQRTLLYDLKGEELLYKGKFLHPKIEFIFEKDEKLDSEIISFENNIELLLKLTVTDKPKELIKVEKITPNNQEQLEVFTNKILDKLIKGCILNNSIPKYNVPESILEKIFSNIVCDLKYLKKGNKRNQISINEAVKKTNQILFNINFILNKIKIEDKILSHLFEILKTTLNFLEVGNPEKVKEIELTLEEYFEIKSIKYYDKKFNIDENLLTKIVYIWKLFKSKKIKINYTDIDIKKLLPQIDEFTEINFRIKYKADYKKIKEIFSYNYKEIGNKIQRESLKPRDEIIIKKQKIILKENFFKIFEFNNESKVIINNDLFKLILFEKQN